MDVLGWLGIGFLSVVWLALCRRKHAPAEPPLPIRRPIARRRPANPRPLWLNYR
jgi:hypothetical protein